VKMVIANKDNVIDGKYYMEYDNRNIFLSKGIYLCKYDGVKMIGISKVESIQLATKNRIIFKEDSFRNASFWSLSAVKGLLYELNDDDEVLQYVVMEEL